MPCRSGRGFDLNTNVLRLFPRNCLLDCGCRLCFRLLSYCELL